MTDDAGYSGTPLVKKLGIKPGQRIRVMGAPQDYWRLVGSDPARLQVTELASDSGEAAELTHIFVRDRAALRRLLERARQAMAENGMIWVSWPKQSSGAASGIGRAEVMTEGKAVGLVDVKVCAVDATWSALKFVIPLAQRHR